MYGLDSLAGRWPWVWPSPSSRAAGSTSSCRSAASSSPTSGHLRQCLEDLRHRRVHLISARRLRSGRTLPDTPPRRVAGLLVHQVDHERGVGRVHGLGGGDAPAIAPARAPAVPIAIAPRAVVRRRDAGGGGDVL